MTSKFLTLHIPGMAGVELAVGRSNERRPLRHLHADFRFGIATQGRWMSQSRGERHQIQRGQLQFAQPGETSLCEFGTDEFHGFRVLSLPAAWFSAERDERWRGEVGFPRHLVEDRRGWARFGLMHRRITAAETQLEATSLLQLLVADLLEFSTAPCDASRRSREPAAVRRARQCIEDDPCTDLPLDELARIAGLSPYYFVRSFTAAVGVPPHAYQRHCRIRLAKQLLADGLAGDDVAAATGFADQSHLIRHFRRQTGITPAAYARSLRPLPFRSPLMEGKLAGPSSR